MKFDEVKQTLDLSSAEQKHIELEKARQMFSQYSVTIFENYLVNEIFYNLYPFKLEGSIAYNYGVFVTIYKLLELISFSMYLQNFLKEGKLLSKEDFIAIIMLHTIYIV